MNNFEEWGAQQKIKKEQKAKAAEDEKRNKLNRNGSLTVNSEVYEIVRKQEIGNTHCVTHCVTATLNIAPPNERPSASLDCRYIT